ncbi:rhodanese-like domain-containing protein [Limisalsivibrio acetivorans]|uniref:rhodanese-like domain-containing protein n=1 Tax=Limisalsivibrio acetivorans TaxID=1304888 RepID=UPI0003B38660|nr:rhodanese-like domain-containing protein [Limisalsivibrio acetivorans]
MLHILMISGTAIGVMFAIWVVGKAIQALQGKCTKALEYEEFVKLIKTEPDLHLIDLTEPDYFKKHHIKGAVNIPGEDFQQYADTLPDDKLCVMYCRTGLQSRRAFQFLTENGYSTDNLYYLDAKMMYVAKYEGKEAQ